MRISDVVDQLAVELPKHCNDFTTNISITSLTRSGTTVTATAASAHGLIVGNQVNIQGAQTPIVISSLTRSGLIGSMTTATDHDITEDFGFSVVIEGATEAEFNGTFTLLRVPNRRELTFTMADSGATTATGSPLLLSGSNTYDSYNGIREITVVPSTTTFEYEVTSTTAYSPASGTIVLKSLPRISGALDVESALAVYTQQSTDQAWAFVIMGDGVVSKSRGISTDATDGIQSNHFFNQKIIQGIQVLVFLPTSSELAARYTRDRCEELLSPICKSLLRAKLPSLIETDNNPLMLVSHGAEAYTSAFYVHQYTFEASLQLGETDTYQPSGDVAFRDFNITTASTLGTGEITTDIDLDDEPL